MPCFINSVKQDECVFLTYEGEMPLVEIIAARYEAHSLLEKRHWNRIIVDISQLRSTLTDRALFELASGLSLDLPQSVRVALVTNPEQVGHAKFFENIARNDGVFMTLFSDEDQATAWVKKKAHYEPRRAHPKIKPS